MYSTPTVEMFPENVENSKCPILGFLNFSLGDMTSNMNHYDVTFGVYDHPIVSFFTSGI